MKGWNYLSVSDEQREYADDYCKSGFTPYWKDFQPDPVKRAWSIACEVVFADIYNLPRPEPVLKGHDQILNNLTLDVKTGFHEQDEIKPHFYGNIRGEQMNNRCDLIVFCALNQISNILAFAGWIVKGEIVEIGGEYMIKGALRQRASGSWFPVKHTGWTVLFSQMRRMSDLWRFSKTYHSCQLPKFKGDAHGKMLEVRPGNLPPQERQGATRPGATRQCGYGR